MLFIKRVGFVVLSALLVVLSAARPTAEAAPGMNSNAQYIYHRAWQLVKDNYYDTSFNGQDWNQWKHKFDGKLNSSSEAYEAVKQMLSSLKDPYTRFLDPKAFKDEDDAINSVVVGIGISLKPYEEVKALIINEVIEGSPAEASGIKYGDEIVAIDGTPTDGFTTEKAAERIRGKEGTLVKLTLKRKEATQSVVIQRRQVIIPAVTAKVLKGNIGYIKLSTFMADDASLEFKHALQQLRRTNGLIIDVRDNPGGLLANAIEIADMLIPQGKIVTTVSRRGQMVDATSGMFLTDLPIVVLVDKDSASASEILAGALKDNNRATLIGTRTFGKGLVQEINRLPGGAGVHITVARYLTPSGKDINKVGIKPDVEVVGDREKQLNAAISQLNNQIAMRNKQAPYVMVGAPKRQAGIPVIPGIPGGQSMPTNGDPGRLSASPRG